MGGQEARRAVEVDWGRQRVSNRGEHDGIHTSTEENEHVVETNALCRETEPGCHSGEGDKLGDAETDWDRRNAVDGGGYDGNCDRMDGATSSVHCCDSKSVETRPLAGVKASQRQRYKRDTTDVP